MRENLMMEIGGRSGRTGYLSRSGKDKGGPGKGGFLNNRLFS